ncbi:MAG TPA: nucleoside-triphosphatase [Bacteroidales bacterium]|nr:nucleoside-triphosphatase [Bacteroidales bacterium]
MQLVPSRPLKEIWLKSAVTGSIWASVEIVLGSFLHNLKIPFTGLILSFISVWLIVSFLQVWKEPGLVWRSGLICAMMKAVSPSAIILGPMIGILAEAILMQVFIFIFGRNLLGYIIGGIFAVLSTLIQKTVNLLILYGFDLVKIVTDLYHFVSKQISIRGVSPLMVLLIIVLFYSAIGIAGAISGYLSGRGFSKEDSSRDQELDFNFQSGNRIKKGPAPGEKYSLILLTVNILFITGTLTLINSDLTIAAVLAGICYVLFSYLKYSRSIRRLLKIKFWLSFIIITFCAAFLWEGVSTGEYFSMPGLLVGLKMNARAVILVLGFSAISIELKNPVIKSILFRNGLESVYQSLDLAFSALPFLLSSLSERKENSASGISRSSLKGLLSKADILLDLFKKEHFKRPEIIIITGEIHQGKTTLANKTVLRLKEENFRVGGFLSPGVNNDKGRVGFRLYDIDTAEQYELCSTEGRGYGIKTGKYSFNPETINTGSHILDPENSKDKQLIVIDEIGPLELSGKGWYHAIERLCLYSTVTQLWVVRKKLLDRVTRKWNTGNVYIFDISAENEELIIAGIIKLVRDKAGLMTTLPDPAH